MCKMGLDAVIEQFAKNINNMRYTRFLMECGILLFGSGIKVCYKVKYDRNDCIGWIFRSFMVHVKERDRKT